METQRINEIVYVQNPSFLVSESKEARRYETGATEPLVPGYYFALWPPRARERHHDASVRYFGPFPTREAAQMVKTGALSFALTGPGSAQHVRRKKPELPGFIHPALRCA